MINFISILGLAILSVISDCLSKIHYSISSFFLYIISALCWVLFFRYSTMDLNKIVVVYGLLNLLLGVGAGMMFFSEQISVINFFGIMLAIFAIILVNI